MVPMPRDARFQVRGPPYVFPVPADQHRANHARTYDEWWTQEPGWTRPEQSKADSVQAELERGTPRTEAPSEERLSSSAARRLRRKRAMERQNRQAEPRGAPAAPDLAELRQLLDTEASEAARRLRGHVYAFARDPAACRVLQEAIERSGSREGLELVQELQGHVWELAMCPHGNYVVQKVVSHLSVSSSNFVVKELQGYAVRAAKHRFACRILCRLLEFSGKPAATLVEELLEDVASLCCHSFAHHVVQSVLEHGEAQHKQRIAQTLLADCYRFATHKHSSYLVEKALCYCSDQDQMDLIRALSNPEMILELARTAYGSFVAHTVLQDERVSRTARNILRSHQGELQQTKHGYRLLVDLGLLLDA